MKAVQKMILLPYERYKALLGSVHSAKPTEIIHDTVITDTEPMMTIKVDDISPKINGNASLSEIDDVMTDSDILSFLPKLYQSKAKVLLNRLKRVMEWKSDGTIVIDGDEIEDSHIADLLKEILSPFKPKHILPGQEQFQLAISKCSLPKSFLPEKIQTGGRQNAKKRPPPGIPADGLHERDLGEVNGDEKVRKTFKSVRITKPNVPWIQLT